MTGTYKTANWYLLIFCACIAFISSAAAYAEPLSAGVELNVTDERGNVVLPNGLLGEWSVAIKKTFDETQLPEPFDPKSPAICRFLGAPGEYWFEDSYHHRHELQVCAGAVADARAKTVEPITLVVDGRRQKLAQVQELTVHYDETRDSWSGQWTVLVMKEASCLQKTVFECQASRVGRRT